MTPSQSVTQDAATAAATSVVATPDDRPDDRHADSPAARSGGGDPRQPPGADLASRFVDVAALSWRPTANPGIEMKVLMEDKASGMLTALMRWAPGTTLAHHEHVEIEQTYVLEGHLVDAEGEVTAGNFVWRPKGSRHVAASPNGALLLAFFLRPNIFLDGRVAGQPFVAQR